MARENLGRLLSRRAQRTPDLEGLVQVETGLRLSWAELDARCNRTANALAEGGVRAGDRVALLLPNGPEIFESFLAIAKLGAIAVPLNWRLVPDELEFLLSDSGSVTLLYGTGFDEPVGELERRGSTPVRRWIRAGAGEGPAFAQGYAALQAAASPNEPAIGGGGDDDVVILYTSGTTGLPKGAVHSHRTAIWGAVSMFTDFELRRRDRYLLFMPAFHVGGLNPFVACLMGAATAVVMSGFDARRAWKVVEEERVTAFIAVPAMLAEMLPPALRGEVDASSVRWIMTGASPIPESLLHAYQKRGIEIVSAYGLTEAYGQGCVLPPDQAAQRIGSVGKGFFHLDARVVDAEGRDCAPGVPGEIVLRGPQIMRGYWNQPEATAETIRDGWLHTGDVAVLDEDGYVTIRDRTKDMIISGGENVYPAEIEKLLHGHPGIRDVAVIGQPSARWGESPFAVVVREDPSLTAEGVLEYCRGKLARFKQPRGVAFVDALPRNPSGKLQKPALRERFPGPAPE